MVIHTKAKPPKAHTQRPVAAEPRASAPVKWWAVVGALILIFETVIIVRWVSSPLFAHVPAGPTPVPTYMKVAIIFFSVTAIPAALACVYFLVIRPWRREGTLSVAGS